MSTNPCDATLLTFNGSPNPAEASSIVPPPSAGGKKSMTFRGGATTGADIGGLEGRRQNKFLTEETTLVMCCILSISTRGVKLCLHYPHYKVHTASGY